MAEIKLETAIETGQAKRQRTAEGDVVTVVGPFDNDTVVTYEEDSVTVPAGQYAVLSDSLGTAPEDEVARLEAPTPPGAGEPSAAAPTEQPGAEPEEAPKLERVSDLVLSGDLPVYEKSTPDGTERVPVIALDSDEPKTIQTPTGEVYIPADSVGVVRGTTVDVIPREELDGAYTEMGQDGPKVEAYTDQDGFLIVHRAHVAVANKVTRPVVIAETELDPSDTGRHTLPKVLDEDEVSAGAYVVRKGGGIWAISETELKENWVKVATIGEDDDELEIDAGAPLATSPEIDAREGEVVAEGAAEIREIESGIHDKAEAGSGAEVDTVPEDPDTTLA